MRATLLWLFALAIAVSVWVLASPVGASPDEPSHMAYAWGVATGQGFGDPDATCTNVPCPRTDYQVPPDFIPEPACYAFKPTISAGCASQSSVNPYPSYMTRYPPPYYAVVGTALRVGDAVGLVGQGLGYLGRFTSALISLSMLVPAFAIMHNRGSRSLPFAVVSLVPMALFMIGSINPSGAEVAAAISAAAAATVVVSTGDLRARLLFAYATIWLAWARPLSWMWAGLLFTTVVVLAVVVSHRDESPHRVRQVVGWPELLTAGFIAGSLGWFIYALMGRSRGTAQGVTLPDGVVETTLVTVLRWGGMLAENLGSLGWLDTRTPTLLVYLSVGFIGVMIYVAISRMNSAGRASHVVLGYFGILVAGATATMLYSRFLWQGRYVLPPLAAGLILLGVVGDLTRDTWPDKHMVRIASIAWIVSMASSGWLYGRFAFGLEQGARFAVPNLSLDASWSSPIGVVPFVLLLFGAFLGVPLVLRWRWSRRRSSAIGMHTHNETDTIRNKKSNPHIVTPDAGQASS